MKVIQLNLWLGHLLHSAHAFIEAESPDVLCAQEVYSCEKGVGLLPEYQSHEALSKLFPYHFFAPTFSAEIYGEEVQYGNAIYSKFPISNQSTIFTCGTYASDQTIKDFKKNIRNLQICSIEPENGSVITIANHHGYHDLNFDGTDEAVASIQMLVESLRPIKGKVIFCGDLNASQTSRTVRELDALGMRNLSIEHRLTTTLSSVHRFNHDLACDYILLSPDIEVSEFYSSDTLVSDHKALVLSVSV